MPLTSVFFSCSCDQNCCRIRIWKWELPELQRQQWGWSWALCWRNELQLWKWTRHSWVMCGWWKQLQRAVHQQLFDQEMLLKSSSRVPLCPSCCVQSSPYYLQKVWNSKLSALIYANALLLFVLTCSESLTSQCLSNKRHMKFIPLHSPFNFNDFTQPWWHYHLFSRR